jgi:hypothetical protein
MSDKMFVQGYDIRPMVPIIIWWKTYDSTQDVCLNFTQSDQVSWRKNVFYQATGGFIVGTLASLYTHPLIP